MFCTDVHVNITESECHARFILSGEMTVQV